MFGFADWGVTAAFVLTLGTTAFCVLYGCINWSRPGEAEAEREIAEEEQWEQAQ